MIKIKKGNTNTIALLIAKKCISTRAADASNGVFGVIKSKVQIPQIIIMKTTGTIISMFYLANFYFYVHL